MFSFKCLVSTTVPESSVDATTSDSMPTHLFPSAFVSDSMQHTVTECSLHPDDHSYFAVTSDRVSVLFLETRHGFQR